MKIKTKRYTYNRISRMLLHILVGLTKELANRTKEIEYVRILGFNEKGQLYLNQNKKTIDIPVLSKFIKGISEVLDFEVQTTKIYSLFQEQDLVHEEFKNHLGKRDEND